MQSKVNFLIQNLHKFFIQNKFKKAVIGLSGGVDSALTAFLAVQAIGKENVTAILMPKTTLSSSSHLQDARDLVLKLGISSYEVPIDKYLTAFASLPWLESNLANMNTMARIRMTILYNFANSHQAIVLGTGNKTEIKLGYGTKYGDFGVDVEVIGELWKTEVLAMAKTVGLPAIFYTKKPTAELKPNQTDEDEIGATYEQIDRILQNAEQNKAQTDEAEIVKKILQLVKINAHKTKAIPVISIN